MKRLVQVLALLWFLFVVAAIMFGKPFSFSDPGYTGSLTVGTVAPGPAPTGTTNGMVAFWPMDEPNNSSITDSFNGFVALGVNGVSTTNIGGRNYRKFIPAPNNEWAICSNQNSLLRFSNVWTVAGWFRVMNTNDWGYVAARSDTGGSADYEYAYYPFASNMFRIQHYLNGNPSGYQQLWVTNVRVTESNTWYFFSDTFDGTNWTARLNLDGYSYRPTTNAFNIPITNRWLTFAAANYSGFRPGNLVLGPQMFWKRRLSGAEHTNLNNLGPNIVLTNLY